MREQGEKEKKKQECRGNNKRCADSANVVEGERGRERKPPWAPLAGRALSICHQGAFNGMAPLECKGRLFHAFELFSGLERALLWL